MEEDIWNDTIDETEETATPPDPVEALKAEYEAKFQDLSSRIPTDEDRQLLSALRGITKPKEQEPSEEDKKLSAALELLTSKGVLTKDSPYAKEIAGFVDELKAEREELQNKALESEGYKNASALEAKVSLIYHNELSEAEQKELNKVLSPYYTEKGMKNPVKVAQALNSFLAKREGAELPSKSIETSFKGQSSGTQAAKPTRQEYFNNIFPKLSDEQKQKVLRSPTKPYVDY